MKIGRTTSTIALAIITIVTAISVLAAAVPKPALALGVPCSNCGPKEDITASANSILTEPTIG
jgi:hypothetical protein